VTIPDERAILLTIVLLSAVGFVDDNERKSMFESNVSRRCFLTGALLAATMPAGGAATVNSNDPIERARGFRVRPQTLERIVAGREAFLAEMKPTKAQIARGLELHFDSFVADVQGSVQVSYIGGLQSDQMREQLKPDRSRLRE